MKALIKYFLLLNVTSLLISGGGAAIRMQVHFSKVNDLEHSL